MPFKSATGHRILLLLLLTFAGVQVPDAHGSSCTTQSQMTSVQRDSLMASARSIASLLQSADVEALRANTLAAVAADFSGIAASVKALQPQLQSAILTVEELYLLDASTNPSGGPSRTDFYCGSPVVALNFNSLPTGTYAFAIVHATGVPQPQQIAIILSKGTDNRWMLAGFFAKPMIAAGHDGLWYWSSARKYAQTKMNWDAWLYYRIASNLLDPVDFLSSPNLEKLQREADSMRPDNVPGEKPISLNANGTSFIVTAVDSTTVFGELDLDVKYNPDAVQAAQLHDPPAARTQVTEVMSALLELHPELQAAFHGIWVHADQGNASLFALELPMNEIASSPKPVGVSAHISDQ
jgi:hypothetical protein